MSYTETGQRENPGPAGDCPKIEIDRQLTLFGRDLLQRLPLAQIRLHSQFAYDTSEMEYAEIIRTIVMEEIGEGEGANFVILQRALDQLLRSPRASG